MGRLKRGWLFLSGAVACAIALALPYRARLLFAKVLNYWSNPFGHTIAILFGRQAKFWNRVLLGVVFFLGFPVAALLVRVAGRNHLAPRSGAPTYWVPRSNPDAFEKGIRDPF